MNNRFPIVLVAVCVVAAVAAAVWMMSTEPQDQPAPAPDTSTLAATGNAAGDELPALTIETGREVIDDPSQDGWGTEVLGSRADKQLKHLAGWMLGTEPMDAAHAAAVATEGFQATRLADVEHDEVFDDGVVHVLRATLPAEPVYVEGDGPQALLDAMAHLLEPFAGTTDRDVKFKTYNVIPGEDGYSTRHYVALFGKSETGSVEQNATWLIDWRFQAGDEKPMMQRIVLEDYERVTVSADGQTLFADCTEAVLAHNPAFNAQLMHSVTYWQARLQSDIGLDPHGYHGLAVGDVNGDGLDDIYVCQTGGLPNRLFVQNADGTATDVSKAAGVDFLDLTRAALFVDLDNDGDPDLVATVRGGVVFAENNGKGVFTVRRAVDVGENLFGLAAADYDNDGRLDIYVCAYGGDTLSGAEQTGPVPYHDANNGAPNALLRNAGPWTFTNVTEAVGLNHNNSRWSFAAQWEDYDNDGDLDLYVANDYGRNNLYRNNGDGTFSDVAGEAGVEDISAGMSVAWGDVNRDGHMDVYVSNMFSSAGNRITYQRQFKTGLDDATLSQFQRHARGNSLFQNAGDGTFRDVSVAANVTMGRWAWGSNFVDLNNDGWDDLVIANGFITNEIADDL